MNISELNAGAARVDLTPRHSCFLHGYPHVPRMSTGTHDPLLANALYLECDGGACLFIAVDLLLICKEMTGRIRGRISAQTGLASDCVLVSATHTHSGPVTVTVLSNEADPAVPPPDLAVMARIEDAIIQAGVDAWKNRLPAEAAFVETHADGIGTARHEPHGPNDLAVPVLAIRERGNGAFIGVLMICSMHPTVLHEDSTLFSGDFPAFARTIIQRDLVGLECPVVYHTGVCGDQSPRHVTKANTFAEAERLGELLGVGVVRAMKEAVYHPTWPIRTATTVVDLPARIPPSVTDASNELASAAQRLKALRDTHVPRTEIRTAECDWFGAEESLSIARAAEDGRLAAALRTILPAEIQVIRVGDRQFVGWPGEFFVEFGLRLKQVHPKAAIITLANGELQGYVVTQQAVDNKWYEAGNALLRSPDSGNIVVAATDKLLNDIKGAPDA